MSDQRPISRASVLRMELYLDVLDRARSEGRSFITSAEIGEQTGVSPEKVRQDLFSLGTNGRPKVGYNVEELLRLIRSVFGLDTVKKACLVGFGNLGRALAASEIWADAGFVLAAIFDREPSVIGTRLGHLRVRSIAEVFGVVRAEGITAGVVAVPSDAAQEVADILVSAGIRGIWNFARVKLRLPEHVAVENQSLSLGLVTLSYAMKAKIVNERNDCAARVDEPQA